jgi:hypothetical protein
VGAATHFLGGGGGAKTFAYKVKLWIKTKAIPIRGRGGPYCCETSRLPHFLDDSQMAVRLSALRPTRLLPPGRFLVLISVRG